MFITPEDGARIVDELKAAIGRDVNIMDRTGTIVASTDPCRVGKLHAGAKQLIQAKPLSTLGRTCGILKVI